MRQLNIIYLILFGGIGIVRAQSTLYVNLKNNNQKKYDLASIRSLTFPNRQLQINKTNSGNDTVSFNNLRFFNFTNTTALVLTNEEIYSSSNVQLYPNPLFANSILTIRYQSIQAGTVSIEIIDLNGIPFWQQTNQSQIGNNEFRLQNQRFPSGIYVCRVTMGNNVEVKQLIIGN